MTKATNPLLLSRREAAESLGISVDTLVRLLGRGELRAVRVGRSVRVPATEVESFVQRRLQGHVADGDAPVSSAEASSRRSSPVDQTSPGRDAA